MVDSGSDKKPSIAELEALANQAGYQLVRRKPKATRKTFDISEACWHEFNAVREKLGLSIRDSIEEALAVWVKTHRQT